MLTHGLKWESDDPDALPLLLTYGVDRGEFILRFPPEYQREIQTLLTDEGLQHSPAAEFSAGPTLALEAVQLIGSGAAGAGGGALIAVYINFIRRHRDKRVHISADGIEVSGMSEKAVSRIIEKNIEVQARIAAQAEQAMGLRSSDVATEDEPRDG